MRPGAPSSRAAATAASAAADSCCSLPPPGLRGDCRLNGGDFKADRKLAEGAAASGDTRALGSTLGMSGSEWMHTITASPRD